ncbi:MAG: SDR family NAD(P)-dependent oxidoreductase [Gemmatimonadota bacterium]|nr:SDR family NAD(P)-dependent oxidoreductase [Gemmatimonadota bacterium]MDH4350788.1 SDR family NAD(P)-dependent oxidoreductase [Gemmatimonadota bacterium]MDH5196861.1 SDR family NAD(P)-dependent oxidoreductase [Gemmatimonadota bacterium]
MDQGLTGKNVLVTGGTGALGTDVVRAFAGTGAHVTVSWVVGRERDALLAELGSAGEKVRLEQADVTDPDAVAALCVAAAKPTGRLDVLVQLVGGFTFAPIDETDPKTWHKMLALNATSTFLCAREVVKRMRPWRSGRIITVAAVPAVDRGAANMSAYAAAKAAVLNLTQSLSKELVADGITVNAIAPSIIDTPANRAAMPDADTSTWLAPAAIAEVIVWLAGESAAVVTGTTVMLSKG